VSATITTTLGRSSINLPPASGRFSIYSAYRLS
jgi:hypothetical protein